MKQVHGHVSARFYIASAHAVPPNMGERRSARTLALTCALLGVGLLLFKFTRVSIALFHWAEKQIDRNSPLHMLAFLAVTLPFNIGLPIPIVHQARGWA